MHTREEMTQAERAKALATKVKPGMRNPEPKQVSALVVRVH